jgi:hypothetical protein
MPKKFNRRLFLNTSIVAGAAAIGLTSLEEKILLSALAAKPGASAPKDAPSGDLPAGAIGKLKLSRLISGGNLLSGWCHSRDLIYVSQLAGAYLTETKQFDTLELLEEKGVNAIVLDMMQMNILNKYRSERGGKIQALVAAREDWGDWSQPDWSRLRPQIDKAIEDGPAALILHGGYCDRVVQTGKREHIKILGQAIEYIRKQQLPAGLGSHSLRVPIECDALNITPDFYFKTFHNDNYWSATPRERRKEFSVDGPLQADHNEFHDNIYCLNPEETIEYFAKKEQPWIAFKVLAAGALKPDAGFQFAFENGVDFLAVGMFDFQVVEDIVTAKKAYAAAAHRKRPWRG